MTQHPPAPWAPAGKARQWETDAELDRLREVNAEMLNALGLALATIQRLAVQHGPFNSTDGTQDVIRAAVASAEAGDGAGLVVEVEGGCVTNVTINGEPAVHTIDDRD